jgi:predicted amidohydrolase
VVGAALKEGNSFKNSALYFSAGKLLSRHDKLHLPNYGMFEEARYFKAGEFFESFVVGKNTISMVVCEDLWHENIHEKLILHNPTLIIALIASPARGFSDDGLSIEKKWYEIIQSVAKKTDAKVIFVNRVGFEDGLGFWGGSCVVSNDATMLMQLPKFQEAYQSIII